MSVSDGKQCVVGVAAICRMLGYSVFEPEKENCKPWDLLVNGLRVQVKLRKSRKEQANRVRLKTYLSSGAVAYGSDDVDVFVIRWFSVWYVIPCQAIARGNRGVKNGIYMPSVGEWIARWDVLDGERVAYSQQKCLEF